MREPLPNLIDQRKEKLSEAEEKTFDLLVTEHRMAAIDIDKFSKIPRYDERLERDKASVEKKKAVIKREGTEPTKKAQILEALLTQQIELSDWFGDKTYTIVPAEYDDLFHGVDLALEIHDQEDVDDTTTEKKGVKYLALGIDVTSSPKKMRDKLRRIKDHIADGTLTIVEYFHSETYNRDFYGVIANIPQVVIGTEAKTIKELSELWMTAYGLIKLRQKSAGFQLSPETEQSQKKGIREAKEKLGKHRVQTLLLEEIKIQLIAFRKFATEESRKQEAKGKTRLAEEIMQAANKFETTLNIINSVLQEKGIPDREDVFRNNEDLVFQSLSEAINDFDNL